jgi:hypothetical protein
MPEFSSLSAKETLLSIEEHYCSKTLAKVPGYHGKEDGNFSSSKNASTSYSDQSTELRER